MKNVMYADLAANEWFKTDAIKTQLDLETKTKLDKQQLRMEDAVFYAAVHVSGQGGTAELITESTNLKKGVVNFDKAMLPVSQSLGLKTIVFSYAKIDSEEDPGKVKFSHVKSADMDQAVLRANLLIRQEDKIVFERPVADLMADESERGSDRGYDLENWRLLKGGSKLTIQLEYPEGQSVQAAGAAGTPRHHVEIRLIGTKIRTK